MTPCSTCVLTRTLVLGSMLLASSCAGLQRTAAIDRLKPCRSIDGPTDGYCGSLDVWENRQTNTGRKIALNIVVLAALKQDAAPDPLFFLAGGPGEGAAEMARDLQDAFRRIETDRDIVFVDQRGTGKSNPLDCHRGEGDENHGDSPAALLQDLRECLDTYKGKADVAKYTTPVAMDDVDDVRQFLGYSKIDLYGGSYGSRAALVFARRHPDSVRAVILDGVVPTDMRLPLYMARDSQRSLDLLLQDCEKDASCGRRFPNMRSRLERLLVRLDAHPQQIHSVHPRSGIEEDLVISRFTVTRSLFRALYSPTIASLIPLLIDEAERGNFTGFLALDTAFDPTAERIALGMQYSVLCSEDAPRIEPDAVARETAGTFLGAHMAEVRLNACTGWPREEMEPAYYRNPPSDVPALILSGQLDPVAPPVWGQDVASRWKNSRHIVVPAAGHGTWPSGCVMKLMSQFLNDGSAARLDASCVEHVKRPPFVLGPAGPDAMANATQ